jgi:K+-sensing histidine kinase KdpD
VPGADDPPPAAPAEPASADAPAGRAIIRWGWATDALFAVTAIPGAFVDSDALKGVGIGTSLVLFFAGVVACLYAFGRGLARSAAGDNVAVSNLFFLQGSAPRAVRRTFGLIFLACLAVTAITASGLDGFSVLVPMLPVGLAGTWAARHGVFPPRPPSGPRRR